MARSLWKGAISSGLMNVPVELHSAKKRGADLDMTMLDKRGEKARVLLRDGLDKAGKAGETEEITAPGKERRTEKGGEVIDLMALLRKSVEKHPAKPRRAARRRCAA